MLGCAGCVWHGHKHGADGKTKHAQIYLNDATNKPHIQLQCMWGCMRGVIDKCDPVSALTAVARVGLAEGNVAVAAPLNPPLLPRNGHPHGDQGGEEGGPTKDEHRGSGDGGRLPHVAHALAVASEEVARAEGHQEGSA